MIASLRPRLARAHPELIRTHPKNLASKLIRSAVTAALKALFVLRSDKRKTLTSAPLEVTCKAFLATRNTLERRRVSAAVFVYSNVAAAAMNTITCFGAD